MCVIFQKFHRIYWKIWIKWDRSTRSPDRNSTTVGGSGLYIFDAAQKAESGGYDAAITYWNKFVIPTEEVVKRLKGR
jgi:hypothetical protein